METKDRLKAADAPSVSLAMLLGQEEKLEFNNKFHLRILEAIPEFKAEHDAVFQKQMRLIADGLPREAEALQPELESFMRVCYEEEFHNLVTTVGKNHMLDNYIAGSSFTQVGPYMGLISSVSYTTGPAAGDTMASHGGWTEAGSTNAPTFSARIAPSWSAASGGSKAASSAVSFTMTGAGTLKGAFLVLHTGAVVTLMSTAGTLFSAGLFSGGDQVVSSGNVVQVSYSLGL
jgi:hypothetical protein